MSLIGGSFSRSPPTPASAGAGSTATLLARLEDRRSWSASATLRRTLSSRMTVDEARHLLGDAGAREVVEAAFARWGGYQEYPGGLLLYVHDGTGSVRWFLQLSFTSKGTLSWRGPIEVLRLVSPAGG